MEKLPLISQFDPVDIEARISSIKAEEAKRAELELALYDLNVKQFEIAQQLGIKSEKPRPPYVRSNGVDERTQQEKAGVFDTVGKILEFGTSGSVYCREEDSDDGCGFESKTHYRYEINEGVFCIASIQDYRRFGWSGSKNEERLRSVICAPDGEFPIYSQTKAPTTPENFGRISWHEADYHLVDLLRALRWRRAIDRISSLINDRGLLATIEGREPKFDKVVKRITNEDETDVWTIALGDMWTSYDEVDEERNVPLRVAYKNKILNKGFNIQIVRNNIRPYIWSDNGGTVRDNNYLDYVEKVIERIEETGA